MPTNFQQASLKEIHHRRYRLTQPTESPHAYSDPVFGSFARCQHRSILSAWKRYLPDSGGDPTKPYDFGNYQKELWVFWHGSHDPPQLRDCLSSDLMSSDPTPGSDGGGISYEVRTMLFKAVHNCIERCLNGKGYVRLGQWFVRPLVPGLCLDPAVTQQFSLALNYFLHGESVCAAVEAKLYPPVHSLTRQQCQARTPIILAPHGIAGELTGRMCDTPDQVEVLSWREFFPHLRTDLGFVEVAIGQHRLQYPTDLLFATQAPLPPEPLSQSELNLAADNVSDASLQHLLGCPADIGGSQGLQMLRCACRKDPTMPTLSPQEPLSVHDLSPHAAAAAATAAAMAASSAGPTSTAGGAITMNGGSAPTPKALLPKSEPISPPAASTSVDSAKADVIGLMDEELLLHPKHETLIDPPSSRAASVKTPLSLPNDLLLPLASAAVPTPPPPPPAPMPPSATGHQQQHLPSAPSAQRGTSFTPAPANDSLVEPGLGWLAAVQLLLRKRPLPQLEPWEADLPDGTADPVRELPEWTSLAACAKYARLLTSVAATAAGANDDSASPSLAGTLSAPGLRTSPSKTSVTTDSKPTADSLKSEDILKVCDLHSQSIFEVDSPDPAPDASCDTLGAPLGSCLADAGVTAFNGSSMASCTGSGSVPASDLCSIYPTPPSLENHIHPSPAPDTDQAALLSPAAGAASSQSAAGSFGGYSADLLQIDDDWAFLNSQRHQGASLGQLFTAQNPHLPHLPFAYVPEPRQPPHRPHRATAAAPLPLPSLSGRPPASPAATAAGLSGGGGGGGPFSVGPPMHPPSVGGGQNHMMGTPGSFCSVKTPASVRTPGQPGTPYGAAGDQLDQSQLSHQSLPPSHFVDALRLNLLLSDSLLCLCRDQNFEACNICVCHGGLTGSEAGLYMPGLLTANQLPDRPCHCGFSASANRALGLGSNIFYEDQCDLLAERRPLDYRPWPSALPAAVIDSLLNLVSLTVPMRPSRPAFFPSAQQHSPTKKDSAGIDGAPPVQLSLLAQFEDCNDAARLVLQACAPAMLPPPLTAGADQQPPLLHRWSLSGQLPTAGSDLVRLMKSLRPWFQDSLWGTALQGNYYVTGPMTWQEFHQIAGRGQEESHEPQPLPLVSVYTDRDEGLLIAPTAVRDWERIGLEPYSRAKKLHFVVLAPQQASRAMRKAVRRTMSELSVTFADCRLGEHSPAPISADGDFFLDSSRLDSTELPPHCVVYMLIKGPTEACQLRDTVARLSGGAVPVPLPSRLLLSPAKGDLRALALRVYTLVPKRVSYPTDGRSLCGFGPLKDRESWLRATGMHGPVSLFAPPFVLHAGGEEPVLLCAYCLSDDKRWLLATLTDERGELNYRRLINLRVPDCHRRRKASTRELGPERLLDWIFGLPETRAHRWRLVLSRLGRLGHGELLAWADLLKRASLQQRGARSAALCALDVDPHLRVLPDQLSRQGPLRYQTGPVVDRRVSSAITHILVLPTSASFSQVNGVGVGVDFLGGDIMPGFLDDVPGGLPDPGADIFSDLNFALDFELPEMEQVVGPQCGEGSGQLMQQPLALGYYLSSAPPGPVPAWFRVAPPEQSAVCLRASLHLNLNQLVASDPSATHPLNSDKTADVLRHVLETCHSLSWLSVDPATGDRVSCLPRHVTQLFLLHLSVSAVSASCQS